MRKTKEQKGITLIALIITIIVLLILAVVAIGAIQDEGIIDYAKRAKDEYQEAQNNEQLLLNAYMEYLNNNQEEATLVDCENCTDGTIEGYLCSTCNVVSSTVENKTYYFVSCAVGNGLGCGWRSEIYFNIDELPNECSNCGYGVTEPYYGSSYFYKSCDHKFRGQGTPKLETYDCPECEGGLKSE